MMFCFYMFFPLLWGELVGAGLDVKKDPFKVDECVPNLGSGTISLNV